MKKIKQDKDSWGDTVIYVGKCQKYEYEKQEDLHNSELPRIYDIIYQVENYFKK